MDVRGSQIHRQSEIFGSVRRSYISSLPMIDQSNGTYEEMKRSGLHHLVEPSNVDLSDNLPFVLTFQAIEIERLRRDIQKLTDQGATSVENRLYQDRFFSLERQRQRFSEENEKLNLVCNQLYNELEDMKRKTVGIDLGASDKYMAQRNRCMQLQMELDTWKARYAASQKSKTKEVQDLRQMMDSQRKSMIDRDLRQMTVRHQTQRSNLENQIRKLRDCLEARNKELEDSRLRFGQYEVSMLEMSKTENKLEDYENKLALISQEMMRLNELVKTKQQEIDMYRSKEYQMSQRLKDQERWQMEMKQLRSTIDGKQREVQEWRLKYSRLQDNLTRMKELESMNGSLSNRLRDYEREMQRANSAVRQKLDEIEQWKRKFVVQEHQTNKLRNLQRQISSYEDKITVLTTEIERLNNVLKGRLADIDEWKSKNHALQVTITSYTAYERQNKQLNQRLSQQFRILEQVKSRLQKTENQLHMMRSYERKCQDQESQLSTLSRESDRLNTIIRTKHQELDDFKIRYTKLESTVGELRHSQAKLHDYQDKINLLTQQLERMNNVVRNKSQDYDRAILSVRNLQEQVSYLRGYQSKIADSEKTIASLNMNLQGLKKQGSKWQDKHRHLEQKYKQLESNCYFTMQQKDKISTALRTKTFEYEEMRTKYNKLQNDGFRAKQIENSYFELQNKTAIMSTEFERVDKLYRQLDMALDKERQLTTELAFKVIILSAEVERCQQEGGGMKQRQYAELQEKLFVLQSGIKGKDDQTVSIGQKMNNIESKIGYLMGQLDRYLQAVTQNEKKTRQLEQEIGQYQDYTKKIGILSAEIDRLSSDNKLMDEDTRKMRLRYADSISHEMSQEKMMMMVVIMGAQIDSLRARLSEKEVGLQQMRRSILSPIRNLEGDYRRF